MAIHESICQTKSMAQERKPPAYTPAVLGREPISSTASDRDRKSPWLVRSSKDKKLFRIFACLIFVQFLCGPVVLLSHLLPVTIGPGQFSVVVDLRYLNAALVGISLALLILLPFLFAWSARSMAWRLVVILPLMLFACVWNFLLLLFDTMISAAGRVAAWNFIDEFGRVLGAFSIFVVGIAVMPLVFRARRGWRVSRVESAPAIPKHKQIAEWVLVASTTLAILFLSPLFVMTSANVYQVTLLPVLIGVIIGFVVLIPVFWLLRVESKGVLQAIVVAYLLLCVVVPCCCIWIADFSNILLLPAGSGIYFLGLFTGASFLLSYAILLRAMGYRLRQSKIAKVASSKEKPVVDPFSD